MQHPTSRPRRVRRVIAISAAAVAVMIAPTACDYGGPAQMDMTGHSGHMDGMNMDEPVQEHQVVQVGNTRSSTPTTDDAATASTAEAQQVASERRRGDNGRRGEDGRGRGRGNQTTSATTTAPTGATSTTTTAPTTATSVTSTAAPTTSVAAPPPSNAPLEVLGKDCKSGNNADLPAHTGFQSADAQCVSTQMGAVAPEDRLPSLLITGAPRVVRVGQDFQLKVSTKNLVRDRFLGAAAGGYYLESSFLQDGTNLQRGHFHTACRNLASTRSAPDSGKAPEFFIATQDNKGGEDPDTVTINVTGVKTPGVLQCTSWAGDGSHRTPMMSRANETPAIDSVRIFVVGRGQRVDNNAAATDAAVAPAATGAADVADASADEAKQVQAEEQAAVTQKPDGGVAAIPAPTDAAAVPADPATSAAAPAESAAPPAN
jgi:hypothetical protein